MIAALCVRKSTRSVKYPKRYRHYLFGYFSLKAICSSAGIGIQQWEQERIVMEVQELSTRQKFWNTHFVSVWRGEKADVLDDEGGTGGV